MKPAFRVCFRWIIYVFVCYLAHVPLSLLLSLLYVVHVLSLAGWHCALLHAHVAAVGQSHAGHHGPSTHHGGGGDGTAHAWGEALLRKLHLRLAHVHTCWNTDQHTHTQS